MTHVEAEAIPRGEVALVSGGEVTEGSGIGEVLRDDGVEIVSGGAAGSGAAESVAAPYLLQLAIRGGAVIASAGEDELPVQAGIGLPARIELDDPSHFSAVLGGIAGGVDADRVQVVGSDLRAEAWRAVVREGYAVDHELRLIFRATRMEDGVAFIEPSRLGVDEVLNGTAGQRGETLLYLLRADLHHRGRVVRIYQGGSVLHGHVGQDRSKSELDIFSDRKGGAKFHGCCVRGKARLLDLNLIHAIRHGLDCQRAGGIAGEGLVITIACAGQFHRGLDTSARRVSYLETQLAVVHLRCGAQSDQKEQCE